MDAKACRKKLEEEFGPFADGQWGYLEKNYWPEFISDASDMEAFMDSVRTCLCYPWGSGASNAPAVRPTRKPRSRPGHYRLSAMKRTQLGLPVLLMKRMGLSWPEIAKRLRGDGFNCPPLPDSLKQRYRRWTKTQSADVRMANVCADFIEARIEGREPTTR